LQDEPGCPQPERVEDDPARLRIRGLCRINGVERDLSVIRRSIQQAKDGNSMEATLSFNGARSQLLAMKAAQTKAVAE
jgi:hypothetical protein